VPILQGFAGYKVGMTHVIMVDDHKDSPTEGKEIMVPVTVIEIPAMKIAAIRAYSRDTYGKHALTEVWSDQLDDVLGRRITMPKDYNTEVAKKTFTDAIAAGKVAELHALMYTQPVTLSGVPKKVPDLMEIKVAGGAIDKQFEFVAGLLGKEVNLTNVIQIGTYADIGPWNPHHVRWEVPQTGQMGFQQRTEFNKRILKIGENGSEITPAGGFLHYGVLNSPYVLIKGSIPGPVKRLVRIRPAMRQGEHVVRTPTIQQVSVQSKQG
jgi:large subunit ribosomal protein L3